MKYFKTIVNIVIAIILTISIITSIIIHIASSTILTKEYLLSKLEETDYYSKIYENAKSNFENYIHQSGLDEEVLEDIITKEKIEKDTKTIINNIYEGSNEKIETQEIKDNLNKNIKNKTGALNLTQRKAVDNFIEKICEEYTTTISHYSYENQINNIYQKILEYVQIAKKILLIIIAISSIILLIVNIRKITRFISYMAISFVSTGVFLVGINIFINTKIKIQNIILLNDAISNILRNILLEILENIKTNGLIFLISGIIIILIANIIYNIKKYRLKEEE